MKHSYLTTIIFTLFLSCNITSKEVSNKNRTDYVNPFIGTGGHGHTYSGVTISFGMLQISPINGISKWGWCSGYHYSDSIVVEFSNLALSGTSIGDLDLQSEEVADLKLIPLKELFQFTEKTDKNFVPYPKEYIYKVYNKIKES